MNELPNELRSKLEADAKATIDSYFEPLKDRKQQELQDIELQHQWALENWLPKGGHDGDGSFQAPSLPQKPPDISKESTVTRNGSSTIPTRKAMVLSVLSDFKNTAFKRRDVDAKVIQMWPDAEPKTDAERKNFSSAIAGLMTELVGEGRLEATKGKTRFEPTEYRLKEDYEDTLLKSGP